MFVESTLKAGNYDQIFNGSGVTFEENNYLLFKIECKNSINEINGFIFYLKVIFSKKENDKTNFEIKVLDDNKTVELNLHNFNNSFPVGNIVPLNIGHLNGKKLYLRFLVINLNEIGYRFDYFLYLGNDENGEQN